MPAISTLKDVFGGAALAAHWGNTFGVFAVAGGALTQSATPPGAFSGVGTTTGDYDLTDDTCYVRIFDVTEDGGGAVTQSFLEVREVGSAAPAHSLRLGYRDGSLVGQRINAGPAITTVFTVAYSAASHAYVRMVHVTGTPSMISFQSSPTGAPGSWTTQGSFDASLIDFDISTLDVFLTLGAVGGGAGSAASVKFDDLNVRGFTIGHVGTVSNVHAPELRGIAHLTLDHIDTVSEVFAPEVGGAGTASLTLPHIATADEVIFSEDFDGTELDEDVWFAHDHGGGGIDDEAGVNNERQYYLPANATVADSKLIITAREESFGGADYTSALVTTAERFSFLYGRLEVVAKLPRAGGTDSVTGFWPSIFLLEDFAAPYFGGSVGGFEGGTQRTGGWPTTGFSEVDGPEWGGGRHGVHNYGVARHWGTAPNMPQGGRSTTLLDEIANSIDLTATFNSYSWVWTEDYIAWEFNGQEFYRLTSAQTEIPSVPMFIIANFAIGGGQFENPPNENTVFPAEYQIDSIKVTQPQPQVFAPSVTGDGQISVDLDHIETTHQVFAPASIEFFIAPPPPVPPVPDTFRDHQIEWRGLRMGQGTEYVVESIAGLLDQPALRTSDRPRLRRHGLLPGDDFLEGRVLTATIHVLGDTLGLWQGNVQRLMATLAPVGDEQPLLVRYPTVAGGGQRQIHCRPRRVATPTIHEHHATVVVQWDATDPRIYHPIRTDRTARADTTSDGVVFPLEFPLVFGVIGETGRVEVRNNGNFPTPVRFVITGPCEVPSIRNTNTGQTLTFDLELGNGETLVVDSDTRTVLRNGNANAYSSLTSDSDWFELDPGATQIYFFTEEPNSTATIRVTFHSAWIT